MQFKVGDRVRIRQWDDMAAEFRVDKGGDIVFPCGVYFNPSMKHLCGRFATIEEITGNKISLTDWNDKSGDVIWNYTVEMLEPADPAPTITRKSILTAAEQIVCSDRENQYGSPENSFTAIARLWGAYKPDLTLSELTAHDVAVLMGLLKVGRISTGQAKADNYIDWAGYAACAGELSNIKEELI